MAGKTKVTTTKTKKEKQSVISICQKHNLDVLEISQIQKCLLKWYDNNQRVLPWRDIAKIETDPNVRGYAVWVSEIMLQQTQVATVVSYFNNWMKKWPTVDMLASASLEDVNKVWAGLGYYSRARRLHEGAKIIMEQLKGNIPQNVNDLMNLIPGIGLYSASAIASVAFQKPVGVVDGNVIRVFSRMKVIGAPVTQPGVREHLWAIANKLVCTKRPGDFNQAVMELGAVICTPQNPKCSDCPVSSCCSAYTMAKKGGKSGTLDSFLKKKSHSKSEEESNEDRVVDIENANECGFCIDPSVWKENPQVTTFPCKVEKKAARLETVGVVLIQKDQKYFMTKRPEKGLLAGLWEFPNALLNNATDSKKLVDEVLAEFGISTSVAAKRKHIGEVIHIFSHIKSTYVVEHLKLNDSFKLKSIPRECTWYTSEEIKTSAVSTAMKKVFAVLKQSDAAPLTNKLKRKRSTSGSKQASIKSFFS